MKQSVRKGFTLAEVLITLTVIGVVAALAIPALLNNIGNARFQSSVRKASATLNQALQMRRARANVLVTDAAVSDSPTLRDYFAAELNVIRVDGNTIFTSDGMSFTFARTGVCGEAGPNANLNANAPCQVVVDVNGDQGPNQNSDDAPAAFRDRYNFVITSMSVLPRAGSQAVDAIIGEAPAAANDDDDN